MSRTKGKAIGPNDFSSYLKTLLDEYGDDVFHALVESTEEVTKASRNKLRTAGGFQNRTGRYRKGWRAEISKTRGGCIGTVYNATDYQLTHLLEHGHDVKTSKYGPVIGQASAFPHISGVNDWAIEQFELALAMAIEGGNSK